MVDVNLYPLDPDTFAEWLLEQQQACVPVGQSCDDTDCPLSRFLSSLYGGSFAVHLSDYERLANDLLYGLVDCWSLPTWAIRFVFLTDWAADCLVLPVSAAAALGYLRQACRECGVALGVLHD